MEWIRGHLIGSGSTATVSVAIARGSTEPFAAKSIELSKSETLQREQKILSILDHPRIVSYKGYDITEEDNKLMYNLKMEYLPEGSLNKKSGGGGGRIDEPMISCYARQIVQGLDYLHSIGMVHCDIKGQNILTGKNGCKIADFGCAKWLNSSAVYGVPAIAGTPLFMAPEVARGEEQGCPADIWALGCTILEMATGSSPWPNATNAASLLYKIAFVDCSPEIPENLSDQAKDFLSKCLRRNPKERWTAKQLLKHQFLDEQINGISKIKKQEICTTASPTSILDQDIWNSVQESDQTHMIPEKSGNSPAGRLGLLIIQSGQPNWTWENNWITIRDEIEEKDVDSLCFGLMTELVVCEGTIVESNIADQNLVNFLYENYRLRYVDEDYNRKRCTDERFVNSNLRFGRYEKKQKLNQIHFL